MSPRSRPWRLALLRLTAPIVRQPPVAKFLRRTLLSDRGAVLMLHRFECPDLGVTGHDPEQLRAFLDRLRTEGHEIISLGEMFRRLDSGEGPDGALSFTMDDGYADQAEVGLPILAEFDCAVTMFVTTGFLDGSVWLWWDEIEYIITTSRLSEARLMSPLPTVAVELDHASRREHAVRALVEAFEGREPSARRDLMLALAESLEVDLPRHPPAKYAPMTWDGLRAAEERGARFGPHTVTHPVLSRCSDEDARREIRDSWLRLEEEARDAEPILAYPGGGPATFGERERSAVRSLGLSGAVSACRGYAAGDRFRADPAYRFQVPRFGYTEDQSIQAHWISGSERIWERLRSGR